MLWGRTQVRQAAPHSLTGRILRGQLTKAQRQVRAGSPSCPWGCHGGTAGHGLGAQGSACSEWEKDQEVSESQPLSSSGHLGSQCVPSIWPWDAASRHPSWGRFAISGSPPAAPAPAVSLLRYCSQGPASPTLAPAPAWPCALRCRAAPRDMQPEQRRVWGEKGALSSGSGVRREGRRGPRGSVQSVSICSNHVLSRSLLLSTWPFWDEVRVPLPIRPQYGRWKRGRGLWHHDPKRGSFLLGPASHVLTLLLRTPSNSVHS